MKHEIFQDGQLIESTEYFKYETVEEYKDFLITKVDEKISNGIVSNGFQFDGKTFSMSFNAQINWSNLLTIPEAVFPLPVSTKQDEIYQLSLANRMNFYLSALGTKNTQLQAGNTIKQEVKLLTTLQECEDFENAL